MEIFLGLHGLWEGIIKLPRRPPPPFDIEKRRRHVGVLAGGDAGASRVSPPAGRANQTMEPIRPPWRTLKEGIPVENPEDDPAWFDQTTLWQGPEVPLDDNRIVVFAFD